MSVTIYRELSDPSPELVQWLEDRDQLFVVVDPKGNEHTYVDNGTPRDSWVNETICGGPQVPYAGCTKAFALFSDEGVFIAEYARMDAAERAAAKVKPVVVMELDDEDPAKGLSWQSDVGYGTDEEVEAARPNG
jgi:hypothetical protein